MSSPRVLSNKKNFTTVNDIWEAYYSENKFAITSDVQKALKYVPIYYQKKNRSAMAAAYSLWNSAEQRFEVFCPINAVFRSANLHELGHIYFGHLKNSRKYIVMAEKLLKPYKNQIADFLDISRYNVIHDIINVCMDFEINSKLFVTKKEREELNASVQFYLLRRYNTSVINSKIKSFDPDSLSKETIIFFPEDFGFPGKKSFLEYVQMMIDYCVHHKKPEILKDKVGLPREQPDCQSSGKGDLTISLPSDKNPEDEEEAPENKDIDSPINKEDNNNSDKESKMPSFEKSEEEKSSENNEGTPTSENDKGKEENKEDEPNNESNENGPHADESSLHDEDDKNLLPSIEDVDDDTFGKRFRANCDTEERKDRIKFEDCHQNGRKNPFYEINGETLSNEINNSHDWMHRHEEEEEEIKNLKEKVDTASNATEINNFILKNALPSIDVSSYNDILYNYNRGKTTDVFINKVRTRSTFRKPNVHIYTDVSGSMDPEYTKKIVKAVKAISSRIDNRSSLTFYNEWDLNTEKFNTLSDEVINRSFVGGGTELARALRRSYVKTQENNSANTLVIISDFRDDIASIKSQFDNIKSTIICIEVGNCNNDNIAQDFENYGIKNVKLLKVVDRKYAA